jgi:hypothetical protein
MEKSPVESITGVVPRVIFSAYLFNQQADDEGSDAQDNPG